MDQTETQAAETTLCALDILDAGALEEFLATHQFNVVTCNFVLFQYEEAMRARTVENILAQLPSLSLLLTMDPSHGLAEPGASVTGYLHGENEPLHLADVSDAHLIGTVTCGADLERVAGQR